MGSLYRFNCRRLDRFVHGRVIFAGDAAHQVSPFGARGGNSGMQDAENLAWKLAAVLQAARRRKRSSTATTSSACRPPTRTSAIPRARPTSSLRIRARSAGCATRCFRSAPARRVRPAHGQFRPAVDRRPSTTRRLSTPDEAPFAGAARLGAPVPDAPMPDARRRATAFCSSSSPAASTCCMSGTAPRPARCRGVKLDRHRRGSARPQPACSRSASMRRRAPPICCGPTSTCARAGAGSTATR